MRPGLSSAMIGLGLFAVPAQAAAQQAAAEFRVPEREIVTRGPDGRALTVRVDGRIYPVCRTRTQDNCIQPRAARLGWGDWPARHYRGGNASAGRQPR